jgi:hypothetical protein
MLGHGANSHTIPAPMTGYKISRGNTSGFFLAPSSAVNIIGPTITRKVAQSSHQGLRRPACQRNLEAAHPAGAPTASHATIVTFRNHDRPECDTCFSAASQPEFGDSYRLSRRHRCFRFPKSCSLRHLTLFFYPGHLLPDQRIRMLLKIPSQTPKSTHFAIVSRGIHRFRSDCQLGQTCNFRGYGNRRISGAAHCLPRAGLPPVS